MVQVQQTENGPRELLTIRETAAYLRCSAETVRRYIRKGYLPVVRVGVKLVRVSRQDIDAWLAQQ